MKKLLNTELANELRIISPGFRIRFDLKSYDDNSTLINLDESDIDSKINFKDDIYKQYIEIINHLSISEMYCHKINNVCLIDD